jgi:hypothetical protein
VKHALQKIAQVAASMTYRKSAIPPLSGN